jgi:agmatine deiminase
LSAPPGTPRADGLRMPAEWAPHERTLIAWPARAELWGARMDDARAAYAAVARAIAAREPVLVVCRPGEAGRVRSACGTDGIDVCELPIDDSWIRDNGPIFVVGGGGHRAGVDFAFNAWGRKYAPYDSDDALPARLLGALGVERYAGPLVLEGGAVAVDGEGSALVTEQCLLHPNRNLAMSRAEIEAVLRDWLGLERVIWLPYGLLEDHTDGHVDNVALFVRPGVVLAQTVADRGDPNHERLRANVRILRDAGLEVSELDALPRPGGRIAPYVNLYRCNGAVIVPVAGEPGDAPVLARLADVFSAVELVPVPGDVLAVGNGGVHCITQQVPAAN